MSLMSHSIVETNLQKLSMDIRDLENEVQTTKDFIQELTSSLSRQNIRLHQLETRIQEKSNMMKTLCLVRDHRKEKLSHEQSIKSKLMYVNQCEHYLREHSRQRYPFEEMVFDEIVEYAHKLHLIHCVKQWMLIPHDNSSFEGVIDFPSSEFDFEEFEARCSIDDDKIRISHHSLLVGYIIPVEVWYSLFELDNAQGFTIRSDCTILDSIIQQMTFI